MNLADEGPNCAEVYMLLPTLELKELFIRKYLLVL